MTNPLGNLQAPSSTMSSDIAESVKTHNESSSMGSGDAKSNLESLKALDSVSKGEFPPKVEVSEADDSNQFGETRNVVGAALGGGAAAGSYALNNKIIDYSKRSLTDAQKKEIGSIAAEGVPGDKQTHFQKFKTANLEKAQAIENFGNVVDPEDGRVKKGGRNIAKFLSDHASEADKKIQARHDATRVMSHADEAAEAGSKAAKHMPKSRTLRIAKSLGSWSKRSAGKLATGAAKRVGARAALGAAFPVGTVVAAATLVMDPMVINLVRGGIDRAFGHNPPSVDAEPLPPLTHILPVWHADNKEAEVARMSADEAYEHDNSNRAILVADKFLSDVIDNQFAFDKNKVWPPENPEPAETSHFDNYHNSFDPIIQAVIDAVDATLNPLQKYSEEEPTVSKLLGAREDFVTSISSMPEQYLLDIAEKSKNNTVAFENTYNTFRNSNVHCRELVHTAHNTGETMWGMVGDPRRMFAPRVLQIEDLMVIERDFKEQEQNLTKAHQELKNAGKNWSYTDNGTSPIFHPQHLQNKLTQANEKLKDKDKEKLTNTHDTNRTTPSATGLPHTSGMPRTGGFGSSPRGGGSSGVSRPSLPDFKDDVNVDDILDGINTKTTPASELNTPDKPEGFGTNLPDPTDTFKKDTSLNDPDLPDPKTDSASLKGPDLPDPKQEDFKAPEFKGPDIDKDTADLDKESSLPDPTQTTTSSTPHTLSTPPSVNTDSKKPDFTPPKPINTDTKKPDFSAPGPVNTGPAATPSAPKTPTPPRGAAGGGGGGGASMPHPEKPKTQSMPNPAHPAKDAPGNPFNKKDDPAPPDPNKEAQDNKDAHPGEAPEFDNADNNGERENTTISRDGKEFDLKSSKAAKLAELINPTTNEDPKSIREALGEAGYSVPDPGSNVGERVSPMDIQPGDLVIGNELEGIYVGDGQVLTSEGLKPLAEVADFVNEGQGIFRPEDADVDAESGHTGQDATATEDFEKDPEKESKTSAHNTKQGSAPTGIGGMGGNGRQAAASGGLGSKGGNKASVTPKGDPFDPGNSSSASSDPFERISVTGTGGIGRSFGANVPTGD